MCCADRSSEVTCKVLSGQVRIGSIHIFNILSLGLFYPRKWQIIDLHVFTSSCFVSTNGYSILADQNSLYDLC